jgi:uncharacterized protein (DUF305 family)
MTVAVALLAMQKLKQASKTEFDKMWTQMMTEHHQGAIDMSKVELDKGTNAAAKQLAQKNHRCPAG